MIILPTRPRKRLPVKRKSLKVHYAVWWLSTGIINPTGNKKSINPWHCMIILPTRPHKRLPVNRKSLKVHYAVWKFIQLESLSQGNTLILRLAMIDQGFPPRTSTKEPSLSLLVCGPQKKKKKKTIYQKNYFVCRPKTTWVNPKWSHVLQTSATPLDTQR